MYACMHVCMHVYIYIYIYYTDRNMITFVCIHVYMYNHAPKIYILVIFVPRRVRQRQQEYRKDCCKTKNQITTTKTTKRHQESTKLTK